MKKIEENTNGEKEEEEQLHAEEKTDEEAGKQLKEKEAAEVHEENEGATKEDASLEAADVDEENEEKSYKDEEMSNRSVATPVRSDSKISNVQSTEKQATLSTSRRRLETQSSDPEAPLRKKQRRWLSKINKAIRSRKVHQSGFLRLEI